MEVNKSKVHLGIWQAVYILIVLLIQQIVMIIVVGLISIKLKLGIENNPLIIGGVDLLVFGIAIYKSLKRLKWDYKNLIPVKVPQIKLILVALPMFLGLSFVCSYISSRVHEVANFSIVKTSVINNESNFVCSIFALGILVPVLEEILFRGIFLNSFKEKYSAKKAVIYSSLLFSLFHLQPSVIPGTFLAGVVFSGIALKTGSLVYPVMGHILYNLISVLSSYYTDKITGHFYLDSLFVFIIGCSLLCMGVFSLQLLTRNLKPVADKAQC